jgi:hypothetical protein
MVAREYARTMSTMATIYSLAFLGGMFALSDDEKPQFEWDPRSTEAFKIRWGEVILDPAAGVGQIITVSSRLFAPDFLGGGKTKKSTGEIISLGADRPFGGKSWWDMLGRFLRTKLAPLPAAIINAKSGEDLIGRETDWFKEAWHLPIPMTFGDVSDAMSAEGWYLPAILPIFAVFGDGVNRYQNAEPGRFGKDISRHPELEGFNEKTGKRFSYTEAVRQIVTQFKKRGFSLAQAMRELRQLEEREGLQEDTIRKHEDRLIERYNRF